MGSDHILLITRSSVSSPVLFRAGAQGSEIDLSAMKIRAHHPYFLDVLRRHGILMVIVTFAVLTPTLTCWSESSN